MPPFLETKQITQIYRRWFYIAYYGLKPRPYIYVILQSRKELLCMTIEKAVGQELYFWRTKKELSQEKPFQIS